MYSIYLQKCNRIIRSVTEGILIFSFKWNVVYSDHCFFLLILTTSHYFKFLQLIGIRKHYSSKTEQRAKNKIYLYSTKQKQTIEIRQVPCTVIRVRQKNCNTTLVPDYYYLYQKIYIRGMFRIWNNTSFICLFFRS